MKDKERTGREAEEWMIANKTRKGEAQTDREY